MNEQIRELEKQSVFYNEETEKWELNLEKFAELIVQECMNAIYDIDDLGGYHFKAVNAVKQHFGIE